MKEREKILREALEEVASSTDIPLDSSIRSVVFNALEQADALPDQVCGTCLYLNRESKIHCQKMCLEYPKDKDYCSRWEGKE